MLKFRIIYVAEYQESAWSERESLTPRQDS